MIPPLMSSTMNLQDLRGGNGEDTTQKTQQKSGGQSSGKTGSQTSTKQAGRPEKDDTEKSEKTIQNKESMS